MTITTLTRSIVYLAIDWRHFENPEYIIRSGIDYFDKNNSGSYKTEYFIESKRLDKNLNNYPGDSIFFEFRFSYLIYDMGIPSYHGYCANTAINIWNPFYFYYEVIWTDNE